MNQKYANIGIFILAVLISFVLYGNTIPGEFIYDDRVFVDIQKLKGTENLWLTLSNPHLIAEQTANQTFRPLSSFTFALNFFLFGESPASFHVVSILLNALAGFLVFRVVELLFENRRIAIFSTLLFLFLPIHTEAVAFIKARDEILSAIFILLSWIVFIRAVYGPKVRWWLLAGSAGLFFVALLAKEFSLSAPILFLFVLYLQRELAIKKMSQIFAIFLPVYGFYFWLAHEIIIKGIARGSNFFIINPLTESSYVIRFWTSFKIAFLYVLKIIFPINLSASYDYNQLTLISDPLQSPEAIAGIVILSLFAIILVSKKIASTEIRVAVAVFVIPYFIFSKFFFSGGQIMGERWVYFASLGICLLFALILEKIYKKNKVLAIAFLVVVLSVYSVVIIQRNNVWLNEKNLFESMVKDAPNSVQGHKALAQAYLKQGDYEKAIPHVEASMRIYVNYGPNTSMLKILASYYSDKRGADRGVVVRGSGEINNRLLALAYAKDGKNEESLDVLDKLLLANPARRESPIVLFAYALNYFKMGDLASLENYLQWVPGITKEDKLKNLGSF